MATSVSPTDLINALSEIIEEDLSMGVQESLPGLDAFYQKLSTTSMGVVSEGIGRDFKVIHTFREGVAGSVKWVSDLGGTPMAGIQHAVVPNVVESFPGISENVTPGHFQKTISLARAKGNLWIPIEWLRADKLSAAIGNAVQEVLRGVAENIVASELGVFYQLSISNSNFGIAKLGTGPTFSNNRGTNDQMVVVIAAGSIRQFRTGMACDFYNPAATPVKRNTGRVIVNGVRYIPDTTNDTGGWGQVTFQSVASAAENLSTSGIVSGDLIALADSFVVGQNRQIGPLGPEEWLTSTGTIFGVDLAVFQQFHSIVQAINGVFTEQVYNQQMARFFKAYGMQNMPDSLVSSMGVMNAHVENSDGLGRFDRTGKAFVVKDGFEVASQPFVFNGMAMTWDSSSYMPSLSDMTAATQTGGRLWALKTRDQNLLRYVPPKLGMGVAGAGPIPSEVEFPFAGLGPNGIFKPQHASDGTTTNYMEAPFERWTGVVPKWMPGILLSGLTEST